jgi:hypothetical protein
LKKRWDGWREENDEGDGGVVTVPLLTVAVMTFVLSLFAVPFQSLGLIAR